MSSALFSRKPGVPGEPPTIVVDGRIWPVRLVRHASARHYRLVLDSNRGELRLTLPRRASERRALQWAGQQQEWLASQAEKAPETILIAPGALLPLFGAPRRIDWDDRLPRRIEVEADRLIVGGPEQQVGKRIERWLKRQALDLLTCESRTLAASAGLTPGRVGIGDPRSRWGSCSAVGDLRYSWRLMLAPDAVRRATVAHEVAHLRHMDHGPDFHAFVDQLYEGDVATARSWLRREGRSLHRYRFD